MASLWSLRIKANPDPNPKDRKNVQTHITEAKYNMDTQKWNALKHRMSV